MVAGWCDRAILAPFTLKGYCNTALIEGWVEHCLLTLPGLKARGFSVRWVPIGIALTELLVRVPHGCKSSIPHDLSGGYISISGVAALRALMNSN